MAQHPLLDAVVLNIWWRDAEPRRGVYDFSELESEVSRWARHGKKSVIGVALYGQAPGDIMTPGWLFQQSDVRSVVFRGGGMARGKEVRIPAVWSEGFVETYVTPLAAALAKEFDGNPDVWYVQATMGHLGNTTCQPSAGGGHACVAAGWTPDKWIDYCQSVEAAYRAEFTRTPIFVKSAGLFVRDRLNRGHAKACSDLLVRLASRGACVARFGLEGERSQMADLDADLARLAPLVREGSARIALGDDWPLWVPERRRAQSATRGHDEANLGHTLDNALRMADGSPTPLTLLFCQEPELMASHPGSRDYRPEVARSLEAARRRLREVDEELSR